MKALFLLLFALIIDFTCTAQANLVPDQFYYYNREKIPLFKDENTIILIFKEEQTFKNNEKTFGFDKAIAELDVSDGTEDVEFARLTYTEPIDNILIKLKEYGIEENDLESFSYGFKSENNRSMNPTNEVIIKTNGVYNFKHELEKYNAQFIEEDKYGVVFFKTETVDDAFALSNELVESGKVEYAEPDFYSDAKLLDHDPLFNRQFYLHNVGQTIDGTAGTPDIDIDALEAWDLAQGGGIRIAVIDDGVDTSPMHEDLFVLKGYTPSCLFNCDGRPRSNGYHGEPVAGIIGAVHNGVGIIGTAPLSTIIPFRIVKNNYKFKSAKNIGKAINAAWDDFGCDVLNNSWSWSDGEPSSYITDAINNAVNYGRNGLGSIVVFASGNSSSWSFPVQSYPSTLDNTIAVGAVNLFGNLFQYSGRGVNLDVVTPSGSLGNGNITTTDRMGNKGITSENYINNFNGTSASAPQVAGIAALLLSVNPSLNWQEVRCRIRQAARDIGAFGPNNYTGYGLANAYFTIAIENMDILDKQIGLRNVYSTANTIEINGNTSFLANSDTELIAGNRIVVRSGSSVQGSKFHAKISNEDPCFSAGFGGMIQNDDITEVQNYKKENLLRLSQQNIKSNLSIHPNPTSGRFTIQTKQATSTESVSIAVYDQLGRKVHQKPNAGSIEQLDLTEQGKGVYFIKIQVGNEFLNRKLVVQ